MIASIETYYNKLGGSHRDREEGSELQRLLHIVKNNAESEASHTNEDKQKKSKRKLGRQSDSAKAIQLMLPPKHFKNLNDWSIHREEEMNNEVTNKDQLLDISRRIWVEVFDSAS